MAPEPMIAIFKVSLRSFLSASSYPKTGSHFSERCSIRPHAPPQRRDVGARIGVVFHDRVAARKLLDLLPGHAAGLDQLRDPEMIVYERLAGHSTDNKI